jgi:hypothetical protein
MTQLFWNMLDVYIFVWFVEIKLKVGILLPNKEYFSLQGTALSFVSIRERILMEEVENHLKGVYAEGEKVFRLVS